ncbi:MAG: hypothetical protein KC442_23375, partial [Thermomicrobiales bacterium]|nr:hypothetical protein [Thermomicrobiales bacterium]
VAPKKKAKKLLKKGATKGACVPVLTTAPPRCGTGGPCVVFQANGILGSVLNGLAGADQHCMNNAAQNAALSGRQFKAWLSGGGQSPSTRFTNLANAGPYVLVGNANDNGNPPPTVASSFAALTSCDNLGETCLLHAIDRNENGSDNGTSSFVWTGTREDGTGDTFTCDVWSDDGPTNEGLFGETTKTTSAWTASNVSTSCSGTVNGVYCFEQAT